MKWSNPKNDKPTSRSGAVGARAGTDKSFGMQCDPKFPIIIVPEPTMRATLHVECCPVFARWKVCKG